MTVRYFIAIPGSTDPPKGPLAIGDIEQQYRAGTIPKDAVLCKVGEATWVEAGALFPERAVPPVAVVERQRELRSSKGPDRFEAGVARYSKLTEAASGLRTTGTVIEVLGVLVFVGTLLAAGTLGTGLTERVLAGQLAASSVLFGVPIYALGMIIGACGEALLALRDIAINTRVTAEAAE